MTYSLDEIIECPRCGGENNWHFVMYYGDECFSCNYDIRVHVRNKSYYEGEKEKYEALLDTLLGLEPEYEPHKVKFYKLELALRARLKAINIRLKRIKNFDLLGFW
jgi:hypothetical protein